MEGLNVNALVLIAQVIISGVLLYVSLKKAPVERTTFDASASAQYAMAAKTKQEENDRLQTEIEELTARLEIVERKKYRVILEFTIGDPPEMGKVLIEPIIDLKIEPPTKPIRRKHG